MAILNRCKEWWRIYNMLKMRKEDMPPEVRDLYEIDIALSSIQSSNQNPQPESERSKESPKG